MNKRTITILSIAGGLVLVLLILALVFRDQIQFRSPLLTIGNPRITFVFGTVEVKPAEEQEWHAASVGETLARAYSVRTGEKSKVDIVFQTGMSVRLTDNTELLLEEQNIREMLLNIKSGSLYGNFHRLYKDQKIAVQTPTALAAVRGTELGFEVRDVEPDEDDETEEREENNEDENEKTGTTKETTVFTLSGLIEIVNPAVPDNSVFLSYQNQTRVGQDRAPGEPERMQDEEVERIRRILNSIHLRDVLLITDKITFKSGSAEIEEESHEELDRIAETLEDHDAIVRIDGHTDSEGGASFNRRLSRKRAESIRAYLVGKGIPEKRLRVQGWGESRPVDSNKTKAGRRANRRVEFVIDE